ncbi:MAG: MoxR family ATPase [Gemmataceae bacterium]|nr:MoxR family ATPase [Gemmataceae bacterium]
MNTKSMEERGTELINRAAANISSALLGKPEAVNLAMVALLADGHLLVEDVPGIGKTLLAKAMAKSIACSFNRIQFTPDLLPSDLLGTSVYQQNTGAFVFQPGPLFAQIVLADEINRATPRTQSALLEAMSDRQISVDGQTRKLGPPFFVLATQNPREFEGTYALPESQLDRFLIRLPLGYPSRESEKMILLGHRDGEPVEKLKPVLSAEEIIALQGIVCKMPLEDSLSEYLLDVVEATRNHPDILLGASPRAALGLYRASQAKALVRGRKFVVPDDIKNLVRPVLAHRILPRSAGGTTAIRLAEQILDDILSKIQVPE